MRYTAIEVQSAILEASKLVLKKPVPIEEVSAILSPYYDCQEFEDLSGDLADILRSMIFALTADAYRENGDYMSAAAWYRRASAISPGGHATLYAHMVCKHLLSEYYSDALCIMEIHTISWQSKPLFKRILYTILAWRMWVYKEGREVLFSENKDLKFLRRQVEQVDEANGINSRAFEK